ncbi:hypothetical protein ACFPRL_22520 [Pseudoclavibacter helvolus]
MESLRMRVWLGSAQARRRRLGSVRPYATPGARRPASPCSAKVRRPPAPARPASARPAPASTAHRVVACCASRSGQQQHATTLRACGPAGLRAPAGRRRRT